jgi:UDP-3-O-[3-hydroxymyristoyl] glucosamine N-acyltransferase
VKVASQVQAGGGTAIASNISKAGTKVWGVTPAMDYSTAVRVAVLQKRIPELFKRMSSVERLLEN